MAALSFIQSNFPPNCQNHLEKKPERLTFSLILRDSPQEGLLQANHTIGQNLLVFILRFEAQSHFHQY